MKIRVNEAESDYIKIGNMVLPKNAAGYGYDDYDTIARKTKAKYNQEKEDERKAKEEEEYRKKGQIAYNKFREIYNANEGNDIDELMKALFNEFVPRSGPCDNLGAEFIRAIERIRYRDYNDGDFYYKGYGLKTCGSSAAFLADYGNETIENQIDETASKNNESTYTEDLDKIARLVVKYLVNTPDLFGKPVVDSREYNNSWVDYWDSESHNLEYEPDVSGDWLDRLIDSGCIDWDDVKQFLDDLTSDYGGSVYAWALDGFTITDLDEDEYDQWDRYFNDAFGNWLDELMEEYEDKVNAYENGEDEDDWEDDED